MQWLLLICLIPYLYILLKIYVSLIKIKPYQVSVTPQVFISVVVACRNEEKNLQHLLKNISAQNYNPDFFEVIVVDDNSSDSTFSIASEFKSLKNLFVLKNNGAGKKQAIRTGITAAAGNLIVTTDADCSVGNSWLKTISSFYSENKPDMVICPVMLENRTGFFHKFQELEFFSLQGVTAGTAAAGNPVMCNGANLAFTKEIYNRYSDNLHDELPTGDDVFLLHSIKKESGEKILWLESMDALLTSIASGTISSFLRQRARWISKAGSYSDRFTQFLAIVTFVTILLEWILLIAGIFNLSFFTVLFAAFLIKSVPDYLILQNTSKRYGKKSLLWFFFPAQLIYPIYIISVFFAYLVKKK